MFVQYRLIYTNSNKHSTNSIRNQIDPEMTKGRNIVVLLSYARLLLELTHKNVKDMEDRGYCQVMNGTAIMAVEHQ